MKPMLAAMLLCSLAGCASVSDVAPAGGDMFMVASQGVVGNGSGAAQKAAALQKASAHCESRGKRLEVLDAKTTEPFFGRAPSADVTFRCV